MDTSVSLNTDAPRPHLLIADDSRIARAALVQGMAEKFRLSEAVDGEQAWERLLLDPSIQLLITDLTMPKLDGYGLLARIRGSGVSRIRTLPVIVMSGKGESDEIERAKAAGASDLIVKGAEARGLLLRIQFLLNQTAGQPGQKLQEQEQPRELISREELLRQAAAMLDDSVRLNKDFLLISLRVEFRQVRPPYGTVPAPAAALVTIAHLLRAAARQSDAVSWPVGNEFAVAAGSVNPEAARGIASRLLRAVADAELPHGGEIETIVCCGMMSLQECHLARLEPQPALEIFWDNAQRRAQLGLEHRICAIIGNQEELELLQKSAGK